MMSTYAQPTEIEALVQGPDPVDWVQMQLTASLPPGQRILAGLQAQAFAMAILSLVFEQPRHGYEIEQVIEERGMRNWLVFHLVAGLVWPAGRPAGRGRGCAATIPGCAGRAAG
jgi:hypothetical protein